MRNLRIKILAHTLKSRMPMFLQVIIATSLGFRCELEATGFTVILNEDTKIGVENQP